MELLKRIDELKPHHLHCNVFSVYDCEGLTIQELLCEFFTKINECINLCNKTFDLVEFLVNEGIAIEVAKKLNQWLEDGTLADLINKTLLKEINDKLSNLNYDLTMNRLDNENWDITINRMISQNKKIYIPQGNYDLYDTIILKNGTNIEMNENCYLNRKHDNQMFMNDFNINSTEYNATKGIELKGGVIVHNTNINPKNLCLLFHAQNIKFENVTFKNIVASHAIDLVGCQNVYINRCKFLGYDHTKSTEKFREVIQIDCAGQTGAGLNSDLFPMSSNCFDGTRTRNVYIENCIFDKSESLPPAHNAIGTHSQIENPYYGDIRSNNIHIRGNRFNGNGLIKTDLDEGSVSMSGKAIRLLQMENIFIEDNYFHNYARTLSVEIFKKYRGLKGSNITDIDLVKLQAIGVKNVYFKNNTVVTNDIMDSYSWNCIAIDSQIEDVRHENINILNNYFTNKGNNNSNRTIGIRNLNTCFATGNTIKGSQKGFYIEIETCKDIITRDNNYIEVEKPIDFVNAYSEGSGESLELWEDGTDNKYLSYILNLPSANTVNNPTLRIKSVKTGKTSDMLTHLNIKNDDGSLTQINPYIDNGYEMPIIECDKGIKIKGTNNKIQIYNEHKTKTGKNSITPIANEPTTISVVFDEPFTKTPIVVATPVSSVIGTTVTACGVSNVTKNGFDITIIRQNTTTTYVNWVAIIEN